MVDPIIPPLGGLGPGSQPEEEERLSFLKLPEGINTFQMPLAPEPEDTVGMEEGKAALRAMQKALAEWRPGTEGVEISLDHLRERDLGLVNQILGEGEVSALCGAVIQAQESVFAGLWRVLHLDESGGLVRDCVEIGPFPQSIRRRTSASQRDAVEPLTPGAPLPEGVFNAPALISEIDEHQKAWRPGDKPHCINFTLLPHTEADLRFLQDYLGQGETIILSRGYGNCRVESTGVRGVWWVRYFNSQDALILNQLEICDLPEVVPAAPEDIEASAERLAEVMELYR
jgi:hydrogenase-1 operon protein HyaF